ncbi:MAG: dihydrofolate reductase [Bacteroidia bacterium]|nr:dihydrofolate reductase [Bacteroidia bacterium]
MNRNFAWLIVFLILAIRVASYGTEKNTKNESVNQATDTSFDYLADRFADVQVLRYKVTGWNDLSLQQKLLVYYLYQAGLSGRDIFYDQKYKYGLMLRKTLEAILENYKGERNGKEWNDFMVYCKRFFFANGNHHHYSSEKMIPGCSMKYFNTLIRSVAPSSLPMEGRNMDAFIAFVDPLVFDPLVDPKSVNLDAKDVITASCNNYYEGVTQAEAENFYNTYRKEHPDDDSQIGMNTKLVKQDGKLKEIVWKEDGMYGAAIKKITGWLLKAESVAENNRQKETIADLIHFYKTGNPKDFDTYSIAWVADTSGRIDFTNGFIEVYQDALQKKCAYESIVSMKDLQATRRINAISHEAQWFEDHSPIMDAHKKKNVRGISAKVITVIGEVGDAAPVTPIGINLPNNEWIREQHGSKSVSLGNIVEAYDYYKSRSPMITEFGSGKDVINRVRTYGALAGQLHTDMHEVIGHASGKINEGVGTTDQTLKNYAGVLEEGRADLVALYYILDPKLVEIGVMPSLEVGKAEYDTYILNGLMTQLQRIEPGKNLEEAHMRNRQMISKWVLEKGAADKVIEKEVRDGKTYFVITNYEKLRDLFGQLLREVQRIKSEGDFQAGKNLVENYGVKVDQGLLKEVHERFSHLDVAPYQGFIQPRLVPVMDGIKISDVKIEYPRDFIGQMLEYAKEYSFLPVMN